jgi:hypothetical protein
VRSYAAAAPDFAALAARQPVLQPFLVRGCHEPCLLLCFPHAHAAEHTPATHPQERDSGGRARLDYTDFGATRALTAALLREDFGVTWWLPNGQLCPTLTSRCNYIHWLEDLLALSPPPGAPPPHQGPAPRSVGRKREAARVRGVDIGTGANAIYALLGAAMNGWCARCEGWMMCSCAV